MQLVAGNANLFGCARVLRGSQQLQHVHSTCRGSCNSQRPLVTVCAMQQDHAEAATQRKLLSRRAGYAVPAVGKPLERWEYEVGPLGANEIDIKVTHNGLCHTDMHMRDDDWGISKFPFIPGHEVVGIVSGVGASVKGLEPGQRVGVGWVADSCRTCTACLRGDENLCEKGYRGLIVFGNHGGFQDTMRINADFAYTLPDGLESADAAPLLCAGVTVYAPLKRTMALAGPGCKVAVLGIGGLGHLALQFAAHLGGDVTAIGRSPAKEAEAKSLGANRYITLEQAKAQPTRFDILINCAPNSVPADAMMALLAKNGALIQVGIPGGHATMTLNLQDVVFNQKRVEGSIVAGRRDMNEMLRFCAVKGVKPMVEKMHLSQVNEAMQKVVDNKARYRVVLTSE